MFEKKTRFFFCQTNKVSKFKNEILSKQGAQYKHAIRKQTLTKIGNYFDKQAISKVSCCVCTTPNK